ncbi:Carboxy-terminal domain (CTD) phosphatase [Gamsiella multidivaricata]|nr:Carboxy-terminal domain (CTD) phosphatase [Gamsiella multidivaricata]
MADNNIKYFISSGCLPATIIAIKTSPKKTQSEGDSLIEYEYTEQVEGFVDEGATSTHARRAEIRAIKDGIVGKIHVKKGDVIEDDRPHLETFLQRITSLYELHIYTMGTRNYAAAVANCIDPDGKLFSQRILSRDENSSMTQKTIERLFPCDTSMVVVIDDRADVWQYSPNLVKVHPYEYFVGAGDINAGHLPKQEPVVKSDSVPVVKPAEVGSSSKEALTEESSSSSATDSSSSADASASATSLSSNPDASAVKSDFSQATAPTKPDEANKATKPKAPVTDDNDNELKYILEVLETIHERFYDAREQFLQGESKRKADVKAIIHDMKKSVLRGVNLVFSSVIPLGQAPERADIWRQAQSFGAECSYNLNKNVTHVVAAKPGTAKVMQARKRRDIKVVRPEWLYRSIGKWQRQEESDYPLLDGPGKSAIMSTTPPPTELEEEVDMGAVEDDPGSVSEGMDENHRPLSIDKDMVNEHLKSVDWDDLDKEVEDFVGDLDDTDFDSDTSTHSNAQSDASTDGGRSPLVNLKRTRIPRRSGLGASVTYGGGSDDEDDEDDANALTTDNLGMGRMDGVEDSNQSQDDSDGDIDEENGSDGEDSVAGSEVLSDGEQPVRQSKRRRLVAENGNIAAHLALPGGPEDLGADNEADMDADDEITMDHSSTRDGGDAGEEEDDDDDFLNDLENDIDAQLNEDDDEEA